MRLASSASTNASWAAHGAFALRACIPLSTRTIVQLGSLRARSASANRRSWAKPLDERQIQYAANDAWFSRELFLKLEQDGLIPKFE